MIETDDIGDLVAGSAGLALVALRIARRTGSSRAFDIADRCCRQVHKLVLARTKPGADSDVDSQLGGLGHGWSGFAVALRRVARLTGSHDYDGAIEAALLAEQLTFDDTSQNWLDLRPDAPAGSTMLGWCSGAPGIGMSRLEPGLASSSGPGGEPVISELDTALATTVNGLIGSRDVLCCGSFGRIAFLHHAGRQLDRPDLVHTARCSANAVLGAAGTPQHMRFVRNQHQSVDHAGLFQGMTGVAWQLCRFLLPEASPELLLLE